ncbi:MAG: transcription termination/antitermination NusG family protein [Acetobacterales bacterium]
MSRWYVARTQPNAEQRACSHLQRQGFDTYMPCYLRRRRHARRTEWRAAPLFPGYVFVRFDRDAARWRAIHSTVGVSHLVCQGERPAPVPEGVVEDIRAAEDETGMVPLNEAPARGDRVAVGDGPFAGCAGLFDGDSDERRVFVLLDLLGRQVRVSVSRDAVQAATAA